MSRFPDGVWLVELGSISDPTQVVEVLARTLDVPLGDGPGAAGRLVAALRHTTLLLVIDNCEHLLETCRVLLDQLSHGCPLIRILATRREALGLNGETVITVPSLDVPGPEEAPVAQELLAYEAVRLFVERARAVRPGFEITEGNALTVSWIRRRLDGMPLALDSSTEKSLISVDESDPAGSVGEIRYQMLETVKDYGQEKLSWAESTTARDRRLEHFMDLAEQRPKLEGKPSEASWRITLMAEKRNLGAALSWSLGTDDGTSRDLRLLRALREWGLRGR